jgi:DNA-binding IclR family transcriptional regulator
MSTALPKPRQLQRIAALAYLDAEDLRMQIESEQARIDASSDSHLLELAELSALLDRVARRTQRLLETLDVPIGVTVDQVAERLDVTAPTVRKWLKEGFLQRVEGRKPVEVDPRSLIELQRVMAGVRKIFPARQWSKALAAYLHDRDLQSQVGVVKGRQEFERGEFV